MREVTGGRTWILGFLMVPSLVGFIVLDAGVGLLLGLATAASLVIVAARARPDGPFEVAAAGPGVPGGVLVIATVPIEEPRTARVIAEIAHPAREVSGEEGPLLVAPAQSRPVHRISGELEAARFESQRVLAVSVATLAAAGIEAEGRVGDGDLIVATEDVLRTFAATEVVLIAGPGELEGEIATLEKRLPVPLRLVSR